jgi:putative ABC transport system permease protein
MPDRLFQDLRFAFRQIRRRPGFSALVLATMAVAIGSTVAIFSVLEGILLRPLPYPESDRLLALWNTPPGERWYQPFTAPDYFDVREQSRTLEEVGVASLGSFNLSGVDEPVRVRGASATAGFFRALGMQPARGRLFTEEEEVDGLHRVVVLSHGFWQSQFGGETDVVGKEVTVNGHPFEVIGVMGADFRFPTPWGGQDDTKLWVPAVLPRADSFRGSHSLAAVGRMAHGVRVEEVEAELDLIAARLAEAYPNTNARTLMWAEPIMERTLGSVRSTMIFLFATVALVLIVASANVASMLLARGMSRAPELAVRASLGAGKGGLVRQLLTESVVLVGVAGLMGILLAWWGLDALKAILPGSVPRVDQIQMSLPVLAFAGGVTLFTGLLVGLVPAFLASRGSMAEIIGRGRASRGGGRHRFLSGLVATQLALGFVLVNAAVVLVASYRNVLGQPLNFSADDVLVSSVTLAGPAYQERLQRRMFWESLVEEVRGLPGVMEVGITSKLPLRGGTNGWVLIRDQTFDPQVDRPLVEYSFVDDGYFDAMGIRLLAGRGFHRRDMEEAAAWAESRQTLGAAATGGPAGPHELPLVINRRMAESLWPGEDPLGELVRPNSASSSWQGRVVGVVEEVRQWGPERPALAEMYIPHTGEVWGPIWGNLVVRTSGEGSGLAAAVRQTIHRLDSAIPAPAPMTMAKVLEDTTARRRFSMILVGLFAATALLLIIAGTYGVLSYAVSQRTHEIGVRMTLGAGAQGVARLFLARVGILLGAGLVLGLAGAWGASRMAESMVYGTSSLSPLHMAAAAGVMALVALGATLGPVLRATAVDPLEALRAD